MGLNDISSSSRIFLLFILLLPVLIFGEPPDDNAVSSSCKYLKNYSPDDYLSQPQNWCIIQDKQGTIYVANQGGLLEFDCVSWKSIDIENVTAYSLAIDDTGTIYVGGRDEIGFLAPDSKGFLTYRSLVSHLDNSRRSFGPVWKTHATKEGVYFWTLKFLFRWNRDSQKIKVWEPKPGFNASFTCSGKLYLHQQNVGLMQMLNDSPVLLPGGEIFAHDNICMMVPYDYRRLLLGTRSKGFYLHDGTSFTPFATEADAYLEKKQLYSAVRLSDGNFALATRSGGLVILDAKGRLKEIVAKSSGLQDNNVWYVFEDFQGNLWLALNKGITKVEYASPFSIYDDKSANLTGIALSVARHGPQQELYAGTTGGLFLLTPGGKFSPIPGISDICWSLLSTGESLLAATKQGIFMVKNNIPTRLTDKPSYVLSRSPQNINRTWVGTRNGLISLWLDKTTGRWTEEYKYQNINLEIRTIQEDPHGNLWLGTLTQGVINVEFPVPSGTHQTAANTVVTHYGPEQGLPRGETHVFSAAGHIMFATEKGLYRFNEKKKGFIPDPVLGKEFSDGSRSVFRIAEDHKKNIWFHSKMENFQAVPQADGTYKIDDRTFRRIFRTQANAIYPDPNGQFTWFVTSKGLVRYDPSIKKNKDLAFQTLIHRIWVNGKPAFHGYMYKEDKKTGPGPLFPAIEYKDRNLRFEFAATFYEGESETLYRCILEGYDHTWTAWSKETWKDYTNVDPGLKTFRVRAINVYGTIGSEDSFRLKILPPWYNTWWAYSFYALTGLLMVFLLVKWRSWKLVKEKQHLEQIILIRTKEIKNKNLQLLEQSKKLAELDKIKSHFFANISHEFRTPLTLITGPLEQMLTGPREDEREQKKKMRLMLRNSRRLLSLINQLLDLSKFDSGKMKLQASQQNIIPFLKGIVESFDSLAVQNELTLEFHSEAEDITLYFDGEKIEKAVCNLLINAIKFTPPGGKITVTLHVKKDISPGFLEISIGDTGIGIPPAQVEYIFDRFYQARGLKEHTHKGSGIGLALAKELASLHHGEISVHSWEGKGSEFTIRLPLGDAHLEPGEIVRHPGKPAKSELPKEDTDFYLIEKEEEEANPIDSSTIAQTTDGDLEQEKNIILVVEDNADVRSYIRSAIEPAYHMIEAKNGEEGSKKAQETIPDLIISDIMMPGLDGYELCRVLKNDVKTSHIPVILLTARAADDDIVAGLETGADDYITKPFNTRILCARIKNLIDLRRQWQQKMQRQMTLQPAEIPVSSVDETFIKDLQKLIEKNLSDELFSVEQLGKKLYMSRATLYRKILALTGEPPREFIKSYRLKRGAQLLKANFGNVTEVSVEVGFSSTAYFTKCFKEKFHQLPHTYQETQRESNK